MPPPPGAPEDAGPSAAFELFGRDFIGRVGGFRREPIAAAPTGLPTWDKVSGGAGGKRGLAQGWFVTLGGNPGYGKTIQALNMAASWLKSGLDVCFVTLEMSPLELANRIYQVACGVDLEVVGQGKSFSNQEFSQAQQAIESWSRDKGKLWVNNRPITSIDGVMSFVRWCHDEHGCKVFVIDYLQLAAAGNEEEIYSQTTKVANALRTFAHQKRALVLGLSQFNRSTSTNYQQTPRAQGLHGGMILEASSDQVMLIDHSRYKKDETEPRLVRTWMVLDKNRYGPRIEIPVLWDFRHMTVREGKQDEENEWPQHGKTR